MERRRFLLGAAAFALPVPASDEMAFKVLRNGTPIGEHHLQFTAAGDDLTVDINIGLLITVAMIPVFHYKLQASEKWSGGVFQNFHSTINNNGTQLEVHADKSADGYTVAGINHNTPSKSYPQYTAPPDTLPLTYWNSKCIYGNVLNIQTAHSYRVKVSPAGWNDLPTAEGGTILAQRFDLTGKLRLSVWYDEKNTWSGLAFRVSGNESYEKITS